MEFNIGYYEGCAAVETHGLDAADAMAEFLYLLNAPGKYHHGFNRAVLDMAAKSFK